MTWTISDQYRHQIIDHFLTSWVHYTAFVSLESQAQLTLLRAIAAQVPWDSATADLDTREVEAAQNALLQAIIQLACAQ